MSDLIYVLDKKVKLEQPKSGFRTSQDAVLLAAACPARGRAERVLDLGCGVGSALICLMHRQNGIYGTGLERERTYVDLARRNADLNGCHITLIQGDVRSYQAPGTWTEPVDHVICNPPYYENNTHLPSPDALKAKARGHVEEALNLNHWITAAFYALKSKGSLSMIHRADQCDEIISLLKPRFGGIEIFPIYSKAGAEAKRVIIRGYKDRRSPCMLHPGLIMHDQNSSAPSTCSNMLLREGASFETVLAAYADLTS